MIIRYLIIAALFAQTAAAQDWTQWRGPTRDGLVPASNAPKSWPNTLRRQWRVEVGEGYSSPVVSQGKVFIHGRRDPDETVIALNLAIRQNEKDSLSRLMPKQAHCVGPLKDAKASMLQCY